jgi:alpha-ketoglutarate-dependent taurine dioxygenase
MSTSGPRSCGPERPLRFVWISQWGRILEAGGHETCFVGAEVRRGAARVDLIDVATNDAAYCAVREAFEEHSVILFRNQETSDDMQVAFSRAFGPLERTKVGSRGAGTSYVQSINVAADATLVAETDRQRSP